VLVGNLSLERELIDGGGDAFVDLSNRPSSKVRLRGSLLATETLSLAFVSLFTARAFGRIGDGSCASVRRDRRKYRARLSNPVHHSMPILPGMV